MKKAMKKLMAAAKRAAPLVSEENRLAIITAALKQFVAEDPRMVEVVGEYIDTGGDA